MASEEQMPHHEVPWGFAGTPLPLMPHCSVWAGGTDRVPLRQRKFFGTLGMPRECSRLIEQYRRFLSDVCYHGL